MRPVLWTWCLVAGLSAAAVGSSARDRAADRGTGPVESIAPPEAPPSRTLTLQQPGGPREFYFTRVQYGGPDFGGPFGRRNSWRTDYPKSDRQFLTVVKRLTNLDLYDGEHPLRLTDPEIRRFPFLYAVEVGYMALTEAEVVALREYLLAGGFLVIDDFWGSWEWDNLEREMRRVFPEFQIVDLPMDHEIFRSFYQIEEILQVPALGGGINGSPTWEQDGFVPRCRGIFDEEGRLMVVINWNTDLGDAWEWAENPYYPLRFSTFAYQMGVNFIVYAMSH